MRRRPGKFDFVLGLAFLIGLTVWALVTGSRLWWLSAFALVLNLGAALWRRNAA
jgi:hypothetical protein